MKATLILSEDRPNTNRAPWQFWKPKTQSTKAIFKLDSCTVSMTNDLDHPHYAEITAYINQQRPLLDDLGVAS